MTISSTRPPAVPPELITGSSLGERAPRGQSPAHKMAERARRLGDRLVAYGLLLPAIAIFVVFFFIPAGYLLYISFFHWGILSSATQFVGLTNFRRLFAQPLFFQALTTTAYYTLVMIPATVFLALGISLVLK